MEECELTLLPKDQCGGKCCRPDLNGTEEIHTIKDFMESL